MKSKKKFTSRAVSTRQGKKSKKRSRSELARHAAQHKRINRQHQKKKYVLGHWHEWKQDTSLHKNQAAFINSMLEKYSSENGMLKKYSLGRPETIRRWIKEFERAWKSQRSWGELIAFTLKNK